MVAILWCVSVVDRRRRGWQIVAFGLRCPDKKTDAEGLSNQVWEKAGAAGSRG